MDKVQDIIQTFSSLEFVLKPNNRYGIEVNNFYDKNHSIKVY